MYENSFDHRLYFIVAVVGTFGFILLVLAGAMLREEIKALAIKAFRWLKNTGKEKDASRFPEPNWDVDERQDASLLL